MKRLRAYFIAGLILLAPAFLTVLFIGYLVKLMDHFVVDPVFQMLPATAMDAQSKVILTKLAIALCVMLFVTSLGFAANKFLLRKLLESGESLLTGIPFFSKIYLMFKEIARAFFGDKSGIFKRVVCLEYPRKGVYALGFVTQERRWELSEKTGRDLVSIFVPSPPNPATGFFIFVPKEELIELSLSVEEGIKMVISGGAAVPFGKK